MKTVVLGPPPEDLEQFINRRRALGQDGYDEVWEGDYHVAPMAHPAHGYVALAIAMFLRPSADAAGLVTLGPFNLGRPDDFRVPDGGWSRGLPTGVWVDTVAIVLEVVSPDDETFAKFPFYASRGVDELIVVEPEPGRGRVRCFRREGDGYVEAEASALLGVSAAELTAGIAWPPPR